MSGNYQYVNNDRRDVCWFCGGRLIWGSDQDAEDLGYERPGIIAHLHCSKCKAYVEYVLLEEEE